MNNKIKFVGKDNEFLDGIPNRDLTEAEWDALSKEQKKIAVDSGLYQVPTPAASLSKKLTKSEE